MSSIVHLEDVASESEAGVPPDYILQKKIS